MSRLAQGRNALPFQPNQVSYSLLLPSLCSSGRSITTNNAVHPLYQRNVSDAEHERAKIEQRAGNMRAVEPLGFNNHLHVKAEGEKGVKSPVQRTHGPLELDSQQQVHGRLCQCFLRVLQNQLLLF